MLENPSDSSSTPNITTIKRYAHPNQRNRPLSRRKSGADRSDRINNNYANDGEKNQIATSRNVSISDRGDAVGSNLVNDNPHSGLVPLHGCCKSEAFQLLTDRWTAAINAYTDPNIDLSERPVMYSGSGATGWGQFRLPHQMMSPPVGAVPSPGLQMDFLSELRRAMRDAKASTDT